ncbi:MAG: VOC family protein [Gammaproteobacteria bacterium]|nr:VOC family protein [Gammaproteobacteria bacterium]
MNASPSVVATAANTNRAIVPQKLAHFVIRAKNFTAMLAWYREVFHARTSFANEMIAFLTYDDEHHRMAFINTGHLPAPDKNAAGFDHVAFTYASLSDLLLTYERLKAAKITPFWCINHGMTTSMYFHDPDGNGLEFQVDNFESMTDAVGYFSSPAFATNPIGVDYDPDLLLKKMREGTPLDELLKQGAAPVAPGKAYVFPLAPPPK